MSQRRSQGFTLLELLVAIAIIGILAAVLFPNLLNARAQAQERAAQAYSSNVAMVLTAVLASNVQLSPTDVAGGAFNCGAGASSTDTVVIGGSTFQYGWGAAPSTLTTCNITGDDATGEIFVEVQTNLSTYVNGIAQ